MRARLALTAALLLGGCISPDYGSEPFFCQTGVCPEGYRCVAGRCRRGDAVEPDAAPAPDAARDAAADAPPQADLSPRDAGPADLRAPDAYVAPGTWVAVKAGTFKMGSPAGEDCRESDEQQRDVTLTRGFEIMTTPVTRAMHNAVRGYYPAGTSSCGACPAGDVTWHEAAAYCNALSANAGLTRCYACAGAAQDVACAVESAFAGKGIFGCPGYRLPTEAEWEYAYRAGSTTSLYNGNLVSCSGAAPLADAIAWYAANSGGGVHQVGKKMQNAWGLYDMSGNVWEWCHDRYAASLGGGAATDPVNLSGADAVRRGGGFGSGPAYLRAANRGFAGLTDRYEGMGLRCVRTR